jgi:hypothetical protein
MGPWTQSREPKRKPKKRAKNCKIPTWENLIEPCAHYLRLPMANTAKRASARKNKLNWPLVQIRWLDSSSPRTGWVRLNEWEGVGSLECVSVGYLIAEDKDSKTLAPHLAYPDDKDQCQGNGIIVIPCGAIVSVDPLSINEIGNGHREG